MCWLFKKKESPLPTGYPISKIGFYDLADILKTKGIKLQLKEGYLPDREVSYTSAEWWAKIAPYLVSPADKYIAGVCDCDDYARMATAKAAFDFQLNGCLECWGTVGDAPHAFNLLVCSDRTFLVLEANAGYLYAGMPFEAKMHGYHPQSWRL